VPLFPPAFRAALAADPKAQLFTVVDVAFPSGAGGTLRFTEDAVPAGLLSAQGRIVAGGLDSLRTSVPQRPSGIGLTTMSVTLADTDKAISSILYGRYDCRRSVVTVKWGLASLAEADWWTADSLILDDWKVAGGTVELHCTTDDVALQGYAPKRQVLKGTFPGAPQPSLQLYCPVVLGIHDAGGLTVEGMIPTIPVSIDAALGYEYMVSLGTLKAVDRVYQNGTLKTLTTHYTVGQRSLGGLTYTYVRFVGATAATDVITCDVQGLTDDGTTAGNVILAPAEQLKWTLHNLIYGDWSGGSYLSGAPIDSGAFALTAAYQSTFRAEGATYLGGGIKPMTGIEIVNGWMASHLTIRARWQGGLFGILPLDHRYVPYAAALIANATTDDVDRGLDVSRSAAGLCSKVSVEYLYGEQAGRYWSALEVQDLARWQTEKVTDAFSLVWSARRFQ
jgi:hypothetical protein